MDLLHHHSRDPPPIDRADHLRLGLHPYHYLPLYPQLCRHPPCRGGVGPPPFFRIPKYIRFALGWLSIIAVVLGSAFGFKLENVRVLYPASPTRLVFLPHLLIRNSLPFFYPLRHELWRSRDLRRRSHRVPVWFLGDVEGPMAHRHRWSVRPAGDRPLRAQIRRWPPHLQMARESRFRLPFPGPCRRCLLLRPRHCQ